MASISQAGMTTTSQASASRVITGYSSSRAASVSFLESSSPASR
ncbi:Uncharacterised protein [Mycobacteroides abscessus subsp. abscessus]|nr:Uncharacterised protein [Mycobacteroides abscessus subsp. abscessus]